MQLSVLNGPMASFRGLHCEVSQKDSTSIDSLVSQGQRIPSQLRCVATVTTETLSSWQLKKDFRLGYLIGSSLNVEEALEHLLSVMAKGTIILVLLKYVCLEEARAFRNIIVDVFFGHLVCFLKVEHYSLMPQIAVYVRNIQGFEAWITMRSHQE